MNFKYRPNEFERPIHLHINQVDTLFGGDQQTLIKGNVNTGGGDFVGRDSINPFLENPLTPLLNKSDKQKLIDELFSRKSFNSY